MTVKLPKLTLLFAVYLTPCDSWPSLLQTCSSHSHLITNLPPVNAQPLPRFVSLIYQHLCVLCFPQRTDNKPTLPLFPKLPDSSLFSFCLITNPMCLLITLSLIFISSLVTKIFRYEVSTVNPISTFWAIFSLSYHHLKIAGNEQSQHKTVNTYPCTFSNIC